jgi:hypothetical protein
MATCSSIIPIRTEGSSNSKGAAVLYLRALEDQEHLTIPHPAQVALEMQAREVLATDRAVEEESHGERLLAPECRLPAVVAPVLFEEQGDELIEDFRLTKRPKPLAILG